MTEAIFLMRQKKSQTFTISKLPFAKTFHNIYHIHSILTATITTMVSAPAHPSLEIILCRYLLTIVLLWCARYQLITNVIYLCDVTMPCMYTIDVIYVCMCACNNRFVCVCVVIFGWVMFGWYFFFIIMQCWCILREWIMNIFVL